MDWVRVSSTHEPSTSLWSVPSHMPSPTPHLPWPQLLPLPPLHASMHHPSAPKEEMSTLEDRALPAAMAALCDWVQDHVPPPTAGSSDPQALPAAPSTSP
jgi:hypothetical protein